MCTIHSQCIPSKHAGSGPEAFFITASYSHYGQLWPLRPVIAITASVQPESARVVYFARSDSPHPFQFRFFQRRHGLYCAKPARIRSSWPGQGASRCAGKDQRGPVSGRTQPTRKQFPTFRLGSVLSQTSWIILCKTSPYPIFVLADCVRFAPNGSGPEAKPVCKDHPARFWPVLPSDPDRM